MLKTINIDAETHDRFRKLVDQKQVIEPDAGHSMKSCASEAIIQYTEIEESIIDGKVLESRSGKKYCRKCGHWKPLSEFSPHNKATDGLHPYCKQCRVNDTKNK